MKILLKIIILLIFFTLIDLQKMIQNLSIKDIINLITKEKQIPKKEIYNYCLSLKK